MPAISRSFPSLRLLAAVFRVHGPGRPLNWHGIATDNVACAQGTYQSPVAVDSQINSIPMVKGETLSMELENYLAGTEIKNLGTTVEVAANGTICRHGKEYRLVQFHLHTPSEHRIDEETYAMEAHFVFRAQDQALSVVGVMIDVSSLHTASPFFTSVLSAVDRIPSGGDVAQTGPLLSSEIVELVGASDVFQYNGSLTTPPCTEGVAWNVVRRPSTSPPTSIALPRRF
ncbi:unnamed protein product [Parascedosporium putredinis]|uniref:Carbonic anhydrase n=1 Tax=Parascedosporium putredinis TaxID=1442378 RepID=A0A9P1GWW0_9PEZI|nr:unnamed protein product [Parascedosporium putredinis]CAI7989203.1 unnamed protein product [Parascedosporium putredinis]